MIFDPENPVYNSIIVYIILLCLIFLIKPNILYNNKENEFKKINLFGNVEILSLHIFSVCSAVIIYFVFLFVYVFYKLMEKQ